jgi:hypothetical protein
MCYQLIELYSACRCLYFPHPVDRCAAYGRAGHGIQWRTTLVGYSCSEHSDNIERGVSNEQPNKSVRPSDHHSTEGVNEDTPGATDTSRTSSTTEGTSLAQEPGKSRTIGSKPSGRTRKIHRG